MTINKNSNNKSAVLFVFEQIHLVLLFLSVIIGTYWFDLSTEVYFFEAAYFWVQIELEFTELSCRVVHYHWSILEIWVVLEIDA